MDGQFCPGIVGFHGHFLADGQFCPRIVGFICREENFIKGRGNKMLCWI